MSTSRKFTPKQAAFALSGNVRISALQTRKRPSRCVNSHGQYAYREAHMQEHSSTAVRKFIETFQLDVDKFWSRVARRGPRECWEWTAARDPLGYGRLRTNGKTELAHRMAYGLTTGECPEAVCHRCDNPSCCNPAHLFGGTREDNNRDMMRKGRHASQIGTLNPLKGEEHHQAKLDDERVLEIRALYKAGGWTQRQLAKKYGVSQRAIARVVNRIGWRHV